MFAFDFTTRDLLKQGYFGEAGRCTICHRMIEVPHVALGFGGSMNRGWLGPNEEAPAASEGSLCLKIFFRL